jgi:AraC-like DNA-binding protein
MVAHAHGAGPEERSALDRGQVPDLVHFRRAADLPGVEIRDIEHWSRLWRCFCVGFEFLSPHTWHGDVVTRSLRAELRPGSVFCGHPGEVYSTPRVHRGGCGSALIIDRGVFLQRISKYGVTASNLGLRPVVKMSGGLSSKLNRVFASFEPSATPDQRQATLEDFIGGVVEELIAPAERQTSLSKADVAAKRAREWLDSDPTTPIDLAALCSRVGLSRFQLMRAFKRCYGLPPHAYQLCVRVGLAQQALLAGTSPATVAADLGFTDQSHLTRHFKRLVGVTPAAYAAARSRQGLTVVGRIQRQKN